MELKNAPTLEGGLAFVAEAEATGEG